MSDLTRTATAQTTHPSQSPAPSGLLQRQCACGQHTVAGGECAACRQKRQGALQRSPSGLAINRPGDRYEQEAERVAAAVISGGELPGRTLSSAPALRRDGPPPAPSPRDPSADERRKYPGASLPDLGFNEPKNDQHVQQPSETLETNADRFGKAGEGLLDPWSATKLGKEVSDQIERFGAPFVATLGSTVVSISAAISTVAAIFTPMYIRNEEIPIQPPAIKIAPGLKVRLTYKGPAQAPTDASVTFIYEPQEAKKPQASDTDRTRADTERIDADQAKYQKGTKTPAERAAEKRELNAITGGLLSRPGNILGIPGYPYRRRDDGLLQRDAAGSSDLAVAPPIVHDVLSSPGQPLDPATRSFMEPRFGHDFSGVRVHTDGRAAASARDVNANAYAVGHNIVFGAGQFAPTTYEGRRLLAHELAHVVQHTPSGHTKGTSLANTLPLPASVHRSGGPLPTEAPLTEMEMLGILTKERAFSFSEPGAPVEDPKGVGRGVGSQAGGKKAGDAVFAIIQITDRNGKLIDRSVGAYFGGSDKHAEQQALANLETKLIGRDVEGGELLVVVDQNPCPPDRKDCAGAIDEFARRYKLRRRIRVPIRSSAKAGVSSGKTVKPRAAARGVQRTDFPVVELRDFHSAEGKEPPTATPEPAAGPGAEPAVTGAKPPTATPKPATGLVTEPSVPGAKSIAGTANARMVGGSIAFLGLGVLAVYLRGKLNERVIETQMKGLQPDIVKQLESKRNEVAQIQSSKVPVYANVKITITVTSTPSETSALPLRDQIYDLPIVTLDDVTISNKEINEPGKMRKERHFGYNVEYHAFTYSLTENQLRLVLGMTQ